MKQKYNSFNGFVFVKIKKEKTKGKKNCSEFWSGWHASLHFTLGLATCMPVTV